MYTSCPSCERVFQLEAAHLSAAEGMVRCGFCNAAFNALGRLHDKPPVPQTPLLTDVGAEEEVPEATPEATPAEIVEPAFPPVEVFLQEEPPRATHSVWKWISALLMLFLLMQSAWHFRSELLLHFPGLSPWVEAFCKRFDCLELRQGRLSDIVLLHRDVRVHPVYQNTVLVNATISNESEVGLPYPNMQLQFYDNEQNILAYREFAPEEYLDRRLPIERGMLPNMPIYLVLELTGPIEKASGFEFGFSYPRRRPFFAR